MTINFPGDVTLVDNLASILLYYIYKISCDSNSIHVLFSLYFFTMSIYYLYKYTNNIYPY